MNQEQKDREVIEQILKTNVANSKPLIGKGEVNRIYIVAIKDKQFVIRLHDETEIERYKKEAWCIRRANDLGIPSPQVKDIGIINNTAFMLLDFIPGLNGQEITENKPYIWKKLGTYARKIHTIHTEGFGESLVNPGEFSDSWKRFVTYNVASLDDSDTLLSMKVFNLSDSKKLRDLFSGLLEKHFTFGLMHGDLSLTNIIVEQEKISLIDWGSAESTIVPHFEIIGIFEDSLQEDNPLFNDFLNGYGMAKEEFENMQDDIHSLTLLRSIDKLRWAIDRKQALIDTYSTKVKHLVSQLL